ncbi:MAG: bifunctional glutamate N-acetyltransferase/amino-acid acetyltransferase ArgJ [Hydrocarboniphaga effusa]|nr:bifunctional glutamate N-acetyltransferase/amino-acid acetyltransferase ArgJ [Hydrocarboniphaga effusa]
MGAGGAAVGRSHSGAPSPLQVAGGRKDLLVIELAQGSRVAGVFTQNAFAAAPVLLCRERLAAATPIRALLVNAGNANAATGQNGLADARLTTTAVAEALGSPAGAVLPFSTGVIGQRLPVERMTAAIPAAVSDLRPEGWLDAARAIMTTDTLPKGASRRVKTSQGAVTVTGIAKGVGMICPDMATLLAFVGTDARLTPEALRQCLRDAAAVSFNCATVDGDTSTNDSCILFATAKAGSQDVSADHPDYAAIAAAVTEVCIELAQAIVRDGEGATRFVTLRLSGARNLAEARQAAYSIAHSPLVKTALFAGDANWGRLVMALGKSGLADLDPRRVNIALDQVQVLRHGEPHPDYREELGAAVLARPEYTIAVELGRGEAGVTIWTCDFSYDYVKINAEYRT